MAVNPITIPENVKKAFFNGLDQLLWNDPVLLAKLKHAAEPLEGLPLLTAGLDAIGTAFTRSSAQQVGWRVFLSTAGETVAADVITSGGGARLAGLSRGEELSTAYSAFKSALLDDGLKDSSYDMWLVRIPGVLLEACWFEGANGKVLIYPVISGTKAIGMGGQLRSSDQVIRELPGLAAKFRAFDD